MRQTSPPEPIPPQRVPPQAAMSMSPPAPHFAGSPSHPLRKVTMPIDEDEEVIDLDNFQDIRMELNATGHNLTSVLINPRESVFDDMFDEFATEQSAPLEYASPITMLTQAGSSNIFTFSSHSSAMTTTSTSSNNSNSIANKSKISTTAGQNETSYNGRGSNHGNSSSSRGIAHADGTGLLYQYTTTPAEDAELDRLVLRLERVFGTYQAVHGHFHSTIMLANGPSPRPLAKSHNNNSSSNNSNNNNKLSSSSGSDKDNNNNGLFLTPPLGSKSVSGRFVPVNSLSPAAMTPNTSTSTKSQSLAAADQHHHGSSSSSSGGRSRWSKQAGDELRVCYRDVPPLFFRPDFSLQSQEMFDQTIFIKHSSSSSSLNSDNLDNSGSKDKNESSTTGIICTTAGNEDTTTGSVTRTKRTYSSEDITTLMTRQKNNVEQDDFQQQDKLSIYLDLVEVALLRQIWLRSPAFFRALDDIKGLQYQVYETTKLVKAARTKLLTAQEAATDHARRVPRLYRRQRSAVLLQEKLLCMQRVVQGRLAIVALLEAEDYFSAMELIAATRKVYAEHLSSIQCLRQLGNQLDDIDNLVSEVMCNKFVSMAIQWEDPTPSATNASAGNLPSTTTASSGYYAELDVDPVTLLAAGGDAESAAAAARDQQQELLLQKKHKAESSLRQLLQSLVLTERTQSALNMYKHRLLEAVKLIVRTCVMEYLQNFDPALAYQYEENLTQQPYSDGSGSPAPMSSSAATTAPADTPFAQRVREMSAENFLSCLSMCFEHLLVSVVKAEQFHHFIEAHLTQLLDSAPSNSDNNPNNSESNPGTSQTMNSINSVEVRTAAEEDDEEALLNATFAARAIMLEGGGRGSVPSPVTSNPPPNAPASPNSSSNNSNSTAGELLLSPSSKEEQGLRLRSEQSRQQQVSMIATSKVCLTAACELAQRSVAQLINLRRDANARLSPDRMKFLWEISLNFVLSLEQVSGSTAYVVRQCLLSQTKSFLEYLHETCKGKLVVALDNERWVQCDVSLERQLDLNRLSSGKAFLINSSQQQQQQTSKTGYSVGKSMSMGNFSSTTTPTASASPLTGSVSTSSGLAAAGGVGSAMGATGAGSSMMMSAGGGKRTKETKPALVDGVEFRVVWSVLLLTETLLTYLDVALHFSPVTPDVIGKIVELFRLFNTRARQLVLGAQAIQSAARLKSISAKHLAIASQSLGFVIALLPHIRAALLAQIPTKHQLLLTELDRVSQEFVEHHGQIATKFVSIVGDFVDQSAAKLRQVDWDHFQGLQCEYFEEIQRNVNALHRVLLTVLPPVQVQDVFSRIFALLNRKIPNHFDEIMPNTQAGKQRILDEITHLVTAFSRLKQIDSSILTESLEATFRKKFMRS